MKNLAALLFFLLTGAGLVQCAVSGGIGQAISRESAEYQKGYQEGLYKGQAEGRDAGYTAGQAAGDRQGNTDGCNAGYNAGYNKGNTQGTSAGYAQGIQVGAEEGRKEGIKDGIEAAKNRCYKEGYAEGYKTGYAEGYEEGSHSNAFDLGYKKGLEDAQKIETEKGLKAGYKAGFAEREKEIRDKFFEENGTKLETSSAATDGRSENLELKMLRNTRTQAERDDYANGYSAGYSAGYKPAYDSSFQDTYNSAYRRAYDIGYNNGYDTGYREGYKHGESDGYTSGYHVAFDEEYEKYYNIEAKKDYPEKREQGKKDGLKTGHEKGYKAAYDKLYHEGYDKGYQEIAQACYDKAFAQGRLEGIEKVQKFYDENAVLELLSATVRDSNNDGVFGNGEKITLKAKIANFGFQDSKAIKVEIFCTEMELDMVDSVSMSPVKARKYGSVSSAIGDVDITFENDNLGEFELTFIHNGKGIVSKSFSISLQPKGASDEESISPELSGKFQKLLKAGSMMAQALEIAEAARVTVPQDAMIGYNYLKAACDQEMLKNNPGQVMHCMDLAVDKIRNSLNDAPPEIQQILSQTLQELSNL
ncbi:MAG: hypothetical protein PHW04_12355 [Candidatus Wallbacteria bacterium]|nr:hypothetical protein [Candidatus Wallbacteria bacterium]